MSTPTIQKVTVSLPENLIAFADGIAMMQGISRSKFITDLIAEFKMRQEDTLAAEGYQFYAQEAGDFATASLPATLEVWGNDR